MLGEFIALNRDEIIRRSRAKAAARSDSTSGEAEINPGVPLFLEQLVDAVRAGGKSTLETDTRAGQHGHDPVMKGLTVSDVVHDYGDVCRTIIELAAETHATISTEDFRFLNRCLDGAIAGAVTMYRSEHPPSRFDDPGESANERMGFLVHELRNLVNTAIVAFEVLKTGNVGVAGSTGAVLNRTLMGLRNLIGHSLDEVRLTKGVKNRKRIRISDFIEEVAAAARLAADAGGINLIVSPVQDGLAIEGDRQILAAVVGNLLQNAFKFTRPHSTVTLTVSASANRVLIEVQDECGGLPEGGDAKELLPSFEQRGEDRTGLGIGLAFSRWGAEANGGRLYARNLPDEGCVFTVDLPRSPAQSVAVRLDAAS
jgi:signal transduction histidine kinase